MAFTNITVKGCLFHFGQALYRKFTKLGLNDAYENEVAVNSWFKKIFCLSLVPTDSIDDLLQQIIAERPLNHLTALDDFLAYFFKFYFSSVISYRVWNHFATVGPRTNNSVEGYNNKLKKFIGAAQPNIYKLVMLRPQRSRIMTLLFILVLPVVVFDLQMTVAPT